MAVDDLNKSDLARVLEEADETTEAPQVQPKIEQEEWHDTVLIVKLKSFGLKEHQHKQAQRVVRELEVAFHSKLEHGVKVEVYEAEEFLKFLPTTEAFVWPMAYIERDRIKRDDRNATVEQ